MKRFVLTSCLVLLVAACCTTLKDLPEEEENMFSDVDCDFHRETLFNKERDEILVESCLQTTMDACPLDNQFCMVEAQLACSQAFLEMKAQAIADYREKKCFLDRNAGEEI